MVAPDGIRHNGQNHKRESRKSARGIDATMVPNGQNNKKNKGAFLVSQKLTKIMENYWGKPDGIRRKWTNHNRESRKSARGIDATMAPNGQNKLKKSPELSFRALFGS